MKYSFIRNLAAAAAIALTFCGCASKVNIQEALQQPLNSQIRTRYHLWYTDSENMSALNFMEGKFIPAGTIIEPISVERGTYDIWGTVSVVDGSITFRTPADGNEYTMRYDEHLTMLPIEDFIRQLFTVDPAESIYKDVPAAELERVKAGRVERGMSNASVLVVLGPPAKSRTTKLTNQSWLYWKNQDVVFRIIFRGNKIRQIASLDKLSF